MFKQIKIHLTHNYSEPIVMVNNIRLKPLDGFYVKNLYSDDSYNLKVSCDGYEDYELHNINEELVEVTLKPKVCILGKFAGVIAATIMLVAGIFLLTNRKDEPVQNVDDKTDGEVSTPRPGVHDENLDVIHDQITQIDLSEDSPEAAAYEEKVSNYMESVFSRKNLDSDNIDESNSDD